MKIYSVQTFLEEFADNAFVLNGKTVQFNLQPSDHETFNIDFNPVIQLANTARGKDYEFMMMYSSLPDSFLITLVDDNKNAATGFDAIEIIAFPGRGYFEIVFVKKTFVSIGESIVKRHTNATYQTETLILCDGVYLCD